MGQPLQFWLAIQERCEYLPLLARFFLSAKTQTASCERLFSALGDTKTKKRNRLDSEKANKLVQIKRQVQRTLDRRTRKSLLVNAEELPKLVVQIGNCENDPLYNGTLEGSPVVDLTESQYVAEVEKDQCTATLEDLVEAAKNEEQEPAFEGECGSKLMLRELVPLLTA